MVLQETLVFAQVFLMQKPGMCQAKEIQARISRRIELWEVSSCADLVGNMEAEGVARERRFVRE